MLRLKETLDPITKKKFERFLNEKDDDVVIRRIKNELEKLLYNKKKVPEGTRKKLEKYTIIQ